MSGTFDDDDYKIQEILVSYRSEDEDERPKATNPKPKETLQPSAPDDDTEFEIRETLDLEDHHEHPQHENWGKKPTQSTSKISSKSGKNPVSSEFSDWNDDGDTEQIVKEARDSKANKTKQIKVWKSKLEQQKGSTSSRIRRSNDSGSDDQWKDTDEIEVKKDIHHSSKIKVQHRKEGRKNETKKNTIEPMNDLEQIDIHKSMFTSKESSLPLNPTPQKFNQKSADMAAINRLNKSPLAEEFDEQNASTSVYLTSQPDMKKKRHAIELKVVDRRLYWEETESELEIDFEIIEQVFEEFLKGDILLPIVIEKQLTTEYAAGFFQLYTDYLNEAYPQQFKRIYKNISKNSKVRSSFKMTSPRASNQPINPFKFIQEKWKKKNWYSKSQLLKNSLVSKLKSLETAAQLLDMDSQVRLNSKQFHEKQLSSIRQVIGYVQMLLSFENAQNLCKQNISLQGIDQKIWKERAHKILECRTKWIDYLQKNGRSVLSI